MVPKLLAISRIELILGYTLGEIKILIMEEYWKLWEHYQEQVFQKWL